MEMMTDMRRDPHRNGRPGGGIRLDAGTAQQKTADFHWSGAVAAGKTLRIMDVNGSISATGSSGKDVVVSAEKKARKGDPASVEIRVEQDGGRDDHLCGLAVAAGGQRMSRGRAQSTVTTTSHNEVNVDFTVEVPAGVLFEGETVNGRWQPAG